MDKWTIPRTDLDPQGHHVVPPTAARREPNFQPNTPTPAQDTNATVPNCSCQRCSDAQRRQQTWIEQHDPQHFSNAVTPYVNQGVNNHVGTALIAPVRSQAQFAPPQAAVRANILPTYTWLRTLHRRSKITSAIRLFQRGRALST